jgi:hypothetical protein
MSVQAKFFVAEVTKQGYGGAVRPFRKVVLQATSRKDESSKKFWEATPSGRIELGLSGEAGAGAGLWFEDRIGQSIFLTFEDVPEDER